MLNKNKNDISLPAGALKDSWRAKAGQRGVTLMETVFALSILIVGIFAVLTMTTSSITLSQASEQNIVAINLAREGLELVRGIREFSHYNDTQAILSLPLGTDNLFNIGGADGKGCYVIDPRDTESLHLEQGGFTLRSGSNDTELALSDCDSGLYSCTDCLLYHDPVTNLYVHYGTPGNETIFRRAIKIEKDGSDLKVFSKVAWTERGRNHQFVLEDYLTEWQ